MFVIEYKLLNLKNKFELHSDKITTFFLMHTYEKNKVLGIISCIGRIYSAAIFSTYYFLYESLLVWNCVEKIN